MTLTSSDFSCLLGGVALLDGSCDVYGDSSGGAPFPVEVPAHQNPKPGRVYQCHNPDQRKITTCVCVCNVLPVLCLRLRVSL